MLREGRGGRGVVRTPRTYGNQYYCHTNRYDIHANRTSVTFNSKGQNHRDDTTFADNKGGPKK